MKYFLLALSLALALAALLKSIFCSLTGIRL